VVDRADPGVRLDAVDPRGEPVGGEAAGRAPGAVDRVGVGPTDLVADDDTGTAWTVPDLVDSWS
jgi:hypothetical protein